MTISSPLQIVVVVGAFLAHPLRSDARIGPHGRLPGRTYVLSDRTHLRVVGSIDVVRYRTRGRVIVKRQR
jgi:hypothetical protein